MLSALLPAMITLLIFNNYGQLPAPMCALWHFQAWKPAQLSFPGRLLCKYISTSQKPE